MEENNRCNGVALVGMMNGPELRPALTRKGQLMFTTTTTTDPMALVCRSVAVLADACDVVSADPVAEVSEAVARYVTDQPRPGDAGTVAVCARIAATTGAVPFGDADTPEAFVRRLVVAVAHDLIRGEVGTVADPSRQQGTRPAAKKVRSRKGQTSPVPDGRPLDAAERDSLALVRHADALMRAADERDGTHRAVPMLGSIKGHTPREVTPRLGHPVQLASVTMSDGTSESIGSPVEAWAVPYLGATVNATHVAKLRPRVATTQTAPDRVTWETINGRQCATMAFSIAEPTETGKVRRARYKVTGHGPFTTVARRGHNATRADKRAARAVILSTIVDELLALEEPTAINGHQVSQVGLSTRGAPLFAIDGTGRMPAIRAAQALTR